MKTLSLIQAIIAVIGLTGWFMLMFLSNLQNHDGKEEFVWIFGLIVLTGGFVWVFYG